MFRNIDTKLLTHYPLLWNLRIVWILLAGLLLHLLFFISGFAGISAGTIQKFYSFSSAGGSFLIILSVLVSLALIISWLVFFLRNNAFKQFYVVDRYFLLKQFSGVMLILFVLITFPYSFQMGIACKTRMITSQKELVREANILNLAVAFLPVDKSSYFKLQRCIVGDSLGVNYQDTRGYNDSTMVDYNEPDNQRIRKALSEPDAFSYKNYCFENLTLSGYPGFDETGQWKSTRDKWVDHLELDSIKQVIEALTRIADKYSVGHQISPQKMAGLVITDSNRAVTTLINSDSDFYGSYTNDGPGADFFGIYALRNCLEFVEVAHKDQDNRRNTALVLTILGYIAVCGAILLLCFRMFSRRIFLISLIGLIIWSIVFGLFASGTNSEDQGMIFILSLFAGSVLLGIQKDRLGKTTRGVLLSWHAYLLPFIIMIILYFIREDFEEKTRPWIFNGSGMVPRELSLAEIKALYPIGYWVTEHVTLILQLNLLLVYLYIAFFFTRLARKWHNSAEE